MRQGETADTVHLLERGTVRITVIRADGDHSLIGVRGPGEPLGELSVLSGLPRTATVAASGGTCVTYVVKGERFRQMVRGMELERALWQHIVRRQQENEVLQAELVALTPKRRLAEILLRLSFADGADTPTRVLTIPQKELVGPVGRSRSWIQEEFRRLRSAGIISTKRLQVVIHDVDRLRRLAGGEKAE